MRQGKLLMFIVALALFLPYPVFGSFLPEISKWKYVGMEAKVVEYQKGGVKKPFPYLQIKHYEKDEWHGVVWLFNNGKRVNEIAAGWWPKENQAERQYAINKWSGWVMGMAGEEPTISEPLIFEQWQSGDQFRAMIRISLRLPSAGSWDVFAVIRRIVTFP